MRDAFADALWITESVTDQSGEEVSVVAPVSNVEVSVFNAGTTTLSTIYSSRISATPKGNPHIANDGNVNFWAETGDYDLKFHDLNAPVRFADIIIGWNAISAAVRGIPSNRVAGDGGIQVGALDSSSLRQAVPIGGIIDWWRPSSSVPIPSGYVICDGTTLGASSHDFGISAPITLPNLINTFSLGANASINDGTPASIGDLTTSAPGIGGVGGTNSKDFSHTHTVAGHTHSISSDGAHTHTIPNHTHTGLAVGTTGPSNLSTDVSGDLELAGGGFGHKHDVALSVTVPSSGGGGATSSAGAHTHGGITGSTAGTTSAQLSATTDIRPKYVGLLKIIKVKRA